MLPLGRNFGIKFSLGKNFTGSSAAWLARFVRDEEAAGSNPAFPTMYHSQNSIRKFCSSTWRSHSKFCKWYMSPVPEERSDEWYGATNKLGLRASYPSKASGTGSEWYAVTSFPYGEDYSVGWIL